MQLRLNDDTHEKLIALRQKLNEWKRKRKEANKSGNFSKARRLSRNIRKVTKKDNQIQFLNVDDQVS